MTTETFQCASCSSSQTQIRERDGKRICVHCGAEIEEPKGDNKYSFSGRTQVQVIEEGDGHMTMNRKR